MKNPKFLKIHCINHLRTGYGKEDVSVEKFLETVIEYNDKGKAIKEEHFLSDNELETYIINQYDERTLLTSSAQYDGQHELIQKADFYYDDYENIVRQDNYFGENSSVYSTQYLYNKGLLIKQDSYDEGEFVFTEKEFFYNEKKLLVEQVEFDEDGNKKYVIENEYNDDSFVVKRVRDEIMEKDRRTFVYEYDQNGNKIKDLIYDYDNILISKVYYAYNEQKQLLVKEDEDLDRYLKTINTFEGENVIKTEVFDKKNKLLSWNEYTYDDNALVATMKQYIPDETDTNEFRPLVEYEYDRVY